MGAQDAARPAGGDEAPKARLCAGVEIADFGARITVALGLSPTNPTNPTDAAPTDVAPLTRRLTLAPASPEETPRAVAKLVGQMLSQAGEAELAGAGAAFWGQVNPATGTVVETRATPGWSGFGLGAALTAHLGVRTRVDSGVRASARAEATLGAGRGHSPVLYVHLGRRATSALVVNGEPLVGAHAQDGLLGHWQTGRAGPRCVCGAEGHLEPLATAQSLARLAIGVASADDNALAAIQRMTHGRAETLTAPQVVRLAVEGVPVIVTLVDAALDALAGALAGLCLTLDPAIVIIGGPLAGADPAWYRWLSERLANELRGVAVTPEVAPAALHPREALIGALLSAGRAEG